MDKPTKDIASKRKTVADLVCRAIMSGICDRNLNIIKKSVDSVTLSPTVNYLEACDMIGISKTQFFDLVKIGVIQKVGPNEYTRDSIIEHLESMK